MAILDYLKNGSGIHIKKANRGKFTDYCGGKVTSECIARGKNSPSATIRKRATFAANARKWKHEEGGILKYGLGGDTMFGLVKSTRKEQDTDLYDLVNPSQEKIETSVTTPESAKTEKMTWDSLEKHWYGSVPTSPKSGSAAQVDTDSSSRMKTAIHYLMSKGLTREGAAGTVGVLFAESGLNPGKVNEEEKKKYQGKAGKGIAQWSNERRQAYDNYMKDKQGTLEDELEYLYQELETSRPKVLEALKSTNDVSKAVEAMHLGYENGSSNAFATPEQLTATYTPAWEKLGYGPYSYQDSHNKRYKYALTAYNLV